MPDDTSAREQAAAMLAQDEATQGLGIEISDVAVGRAGVVAEFRGRSRELHG